MQTRLAKAMKQQNVNDTELARMSKLPRMTIRRARLAEHKVDVGNAIKIALVLDEEVNWLFGDRL